MKEKLAFYLKKLTDLNALWKEGEDAENEKKCRPHKKT